MTPVLPPLRKAAKSARIPIADTTPFPTENKNCRLSAGISDAASLERTAHAPQASTANTEYQNHGLRNIMSNLFSALTGVSVSGRNARLDLPASRVPSSAAPRARSRRCRVHPPFVSNEVSYPALQKPAFPVP